MSGVFTGDLRDADSELIGVDSRRATVRVDHVHSKGTLVPVVRRLTLDLMGVAVTVAAFSVDAALVLPVGGSTQRRFGSPSWGTDRGGRL